MNDSLLIVVIVALCLLNFATVALFANAQKHTLRVVVQEIRRERRRR